jgi:hypothetical protein
MIIICCTSLSQAPAVFHTEQRKYALGEGDCFLIHPAQLVSYISDSAAALAVPLGCLHRKRRRMQLVLAGRLQPRQASADLGCRGQRDSLGHWPG